MSRNFELLKQSSGAPGRESGWPDLSLHNGRTLPPPPQASERFDWARVIAIPRKHWKLAALFAVTVLAVVAVVTFSMKPIYESSVSIEVSPPGTETFSLDRNTGPSSDVEYVGTQVKNLQSSALALLVITELGLDSNPEFIGGMDSGERSQPAVSGEPRQLTKGESAALRYFQTRLTVERDSASRLVKVRFASHDPRTSAKVANTLVSEYIEQDYKTRFETVMNSSAWLSKQLDDIRAKMEQSNKALSDFQRETGIADVDANRNTVAEHMSELNRQLALAQADRIQYEALLKKGAKADPASLPQYRDSPVVQQLSQKLGEARSELSQAGVVYGVNHPKVKQLQGQVNELEKELDLQKRAVVTAVTTNYSAGQNREQLLQNEIKNTTKDVNQLARYNELKKQAQADTDLYNSLYSRVKESGIAAAAKSANIRVVDPARVLDSPTRPQVLLNLLGGLLAGVFGGILLGFVVDAIDTRLRTPDDIRQITGVVPVSMLPVIDAKTRTHLLPASGSNGLRKNGSSFKFFLERPGSPEAEAVRALHADLMLSRWGARPQVLAVLSGFPGEGKTTLAINLAMALSQQGPTCLVDGDLRQPSVGGEFGLEDCSGLAEVMCDITTLDDALQDVPDLPNMKILSAGIATCNPGELFATRSFQGVISMLRERFSFVVVDSSPILPYADGRVISTLVDGVILVGRSGITTREAMARSIELLANIHAAPILEIVLNAASSGPDSPYYRYGYQRAGRR